MPRGGRIFSNSSTLTSLSCYAQRGLQMTDPSLAFITCLDTTLELLTPRQQPLRACKRTRSSQAPAARVPKAARSNERPLPASTEQEECTLDESACAFATGDGHLKVLQWARANGCPWDECTCYFAAMNGHREVLKWACTNGCPWAEQICASAASHGHLKVLKWAISNGCPYDRDLCHYPKVKEWLATGTLKL